jgi:hypothetical protein
MMLGAFFDQEVCWVLYWIKKYASGIIMDQRMSDYLGEA